MNQTNYGTADVKVVPILHDDLRKGFEMLDIAVQDIFFSIQVPDQHNSRQHVTKGILKGVTVHFGAGRLTVVLGASGAGKTSLLNVVAGEVKHGVIEGQMSINNWPTSGEQIKDISGFVMQDDVILETMTVREAILMSALLRLPQSMPLEEKHRRVDEIISLLQLEAAQHTIVGSSLIKGISGGERKRTSIAMEMVTNPSVLFLDEPTSGLDAYTAYSVMCSLKSLAESGRTVVCTLHQPSSDIFHLFDDLVLLADGRVMYEGPAEHTVTYFAEHGFSCPQHFNPADYLFMSVLNDAKQGVLANKIAWNNNNDAKAPHQPTVNLLREDSSKHVSPLKERTERLLQEWKESAEHRQLIEKIAHSHNNKLTQRSLKQYASFATQFALLVGRALRNALRNRLMVRARLAQNIFMGLLIGLIYRDVSSNSATGQQQDRLGSLFFLCMFSLIGNAISIVSIFAAEKAVFVREYGARYYSLPAYFFSKILVELPFFLILPFIMSCLCYFLIGYQRTADHFFTFAVTLMLVSINGANIGILAATVFPSLPVALAVLPATLLPLTVFSGFFVTSNNIPPYFSWIQYISPVKYAFVAVVKNEFQGLQLPSGPGELVIASFGFDNQGSIAFNIAMLIVLYLLLLGGSFAALWALIRTSGNVEVKTPASSQFLPAPQS